MGLPHVYLRPLIKPKVLIFFFARTQFQLSLSPNLYFLTVQYLFLLCADTPGFLHRAPQLPFSLDFCPLGDFRAGLSRATIPIHYTLQSTQLYTTKCSTIYSISMRVYIYTQTPLYSILYNYSLCSTTLGDFRAGPSRATISLHYRLQSIQLYTYRLQSWTLESHHLQYTLQSI